MQKKIIALAIAGLASTAAFAQSNVTIYGRIDYGFMTRGGDDGAGASLERQSEMGSGLQAGSRIGFKGVEDLGNGFKALFQMEFGSIKNDQGKGATDGLANMRNAYVGVTSPFGTVVGGKLDGVRYGIFNKYDAFGGGQVGNFTQVTAQVDRANNALAYISPNFSGVTVTLATATHIGDANPLGQGGDVKGDETSGNDKDINLKTVMVNYANGPIDVTADWERLTFQNGTAGPAVVANGLLKQFTVMTLAGSYDFGMVKVRGLVDNAKAELNGGGDAVDVNSWFLSASAPLGKTTLKLTYGQSKDSVGDEKVRKLGLGAQYDLSKRTAIYTSYGKIWNSNGSSNQISALANCSSGAQGNLGLAADSSQTCGRGTNGFDLGIAHTF